MSKTDDMIERIMASSSASWWLKRALSEALERDPVDASHDAMVLAEILARRCTESLGG